MFSEVFSRLMFVGLMLSVVAPGAAKATNFTVDSGRPVVQLKVNGQGPYPFVFDTGSPGLLVMQKLVDELGLEVVGQAELQSPARGKPVPVDVVHVESVDFGDVKITRVEASVLNLAVEELGMGVVGPAMLNEHGPMTIDFGRQTITVGSDLAADQISSWIPFGPSAPLLDVPIRIGDKVIDGHIDTGNVGVLSVPSRFETVLPLETTVETLGFARTLDAEFEIRGAKFNGSAMIGDAVVPLQELYFMDLPVANLGTSGCRGLLIHIDWGKQRFGVTRSAVSPPTQNPVTARESSATEPRFGMMALPQPDGVLLVAGTDPGSAAEKIGLQDGDRVVAINGVPIADLSGSQIREALAQPDLELTVMRGGQVVALEK